ncbi:type II toxin-antitoxin system VapC family toxin [Sphingomonas sp. CFBP 13603]|uniref:type II toxin-antitoxin system VapC family toxin n=1 Tax=Sphingomonas sp. CFBP 13603 TaxID=2774040 RepID=UPI0018688BA3|nr:type II toxin-antitoxin system VapC family toxin [Sphingomonas sp. CFBP 13603]MBE2993191.1 type II toxin-antitoxin system VapC family toxin [Sphingomonas sp. CFBP 13603]
MTVYCDTSLIIASLTYEAHSPAVWRWLRTQSDRRLYVSDWTDTEVSSALSLKVRTGQISAVDRIDLLETWRASIGTNYERVGVSAENFATAAGFVERYELGLRAADSLHLAIAQAYGLAMAMLDTRLRHAAIEYGIVVEGV